MNSGWIWNLNVSEVLLKTNIKKTLPSGLVSYISSVWNTPEQQQQQQLVEEIWIWVSAKLEFFSELN